MPGNKTTLAAQANARKEQCETAAIANSVNPFLAILPAEIRNQIYELVVITPICIDVSYESNAKQPAITRACRQLRSETLPIYYRLNTFCFLLIPRNHFHIAINIWRLERIELACCHAFNRIQIQLRDNCESDQVSCQRPSHFESYEDPLRRVILSREEHLPEANRYLRQLRKSDTAPLIPSIDVLERLRDIIVGFEKW